LSCSQFSIVPKTRALVPPSVEPPEPPDTAEALLDLVDPEDAGADGLGGLDDGTDVGLRLPDETAEETAGIELQQGHAEDAGGGLGGERLAGAGDAEDEHALGHGQSVVAGALGEGLAALDEPGLEVLQAADGVEDWPWSR
jgi:hypothetical protein